MDKAPSRKCALNQHATACRGPGQGYLRWAPNARGCPLLASSRSPAFFTSGTRACPELVEGDLPYVYSRPLRHHSKAIHVDLVHDLVIIAPWKSIFTRPRPTSHACWNAWR